MGNKIKKMIGKKEQGAALIVAMVLLMIVTMIGMSGMGKSLQSLKMSRGIIDYNYSYQFAETGLRLAEEIIAGSESQEDVESRLQVANISMKAQGTYTDPLYWNDVSFFNSRFPVKIIVQEWISIPDSLKVGAGDVSVMVYYRITARSFDPMYQAYLESGNSETNRLGQNQTVLQSVYAIRFIN